MAMVLKLGNITCDESTVDKSSNVTWSNGTSRSCEPYDEVYFNDRTSLVTAYNAGDETFNYASVISNGQSSVEKFYYVRDRAMVTGGRIVFILEFDPLYTYKDDIYNLPCVCLRTDNTSEGANQIDAYIYDEKLPMRAYREVDIYAADWPELGAAAFSLDANNNVIITAG